MLEKCVVVEQKKTLHKEGKASVKMGCDSDGGEAVVRTEVGNPYNDTGNSK